MFIRVPEIYKDSELSEGEAMIAAYLAMINDRYGYEEYYVINSYDFLRIYSTNSYACEHNSKCFNKLREHMHIVGLDEHNWALKFKFNKLKEVKRVRGNEKLPRTFLFKLNDTRSIMVWCFLMGKWTGDKEIVDPNSTDILPYKESKRTLQRMEYYNFQPDNFTP